MRIKKSIGIFLLLVGISLFFRNFVVTGAVVGAGTVGAWSTFLGIGLVILSLVLILGNENLERRVVSPVQYSQVGQTPVVQNLAQYVLDNSYLITCAEEPQEYQKFKAFVEKRNALGLPLILPDQVYEEFKHVPKDIKQDERQRRRNIRQKHDDHYFDNLVDRDQVAIARGAKPVMRRRLYHFEKIAQRILEKTPKYMAHLAIKEREKNPQVSEESILASIMYRQLGKINLKRSEYSEILHSTRNKIRGYYQKSGQEQKKYLEDLRVSSGDVGVLSHAISLVSSPDRYGDQPIDDVRIISADEDIKISARYFNEMFPKRKNKITVSERII